MGTGSNTEMTIDSIKDIQEAAWNFSRRSLMNTTLKVTTLHEPPYQIRSIDKKTGEVHYTGLCFEILNVLRDQLGFSYEIIEPPDKEWGVELANGTFTGMIGMVHREEVDMGIGAFTITSERRQVVDFLQPWWEESITYMMRKNPVSSLHNSFRPFTLLVWLGCLGALVLVSVTHWMLNQPWSSRKTTCETSVKGVGTGLLTYIMAAMKQAIPLLPERGSSRSLLFCWWLFTIVISAVYSGNLVAIMSVTVDTYPVSSLADLATQTHTQIGIKKGVAVSGMLQASNYTLYQKLWENIDQQFESDDAIMDQVVSGNLIIIQEVTLLQRYLTKTQSCDLALGEDSFYKSNFGFPVRQSFPFKDLFNNKILQMIEKGLLLRWKQKYWNEDTQCSKVNAARHRASLVDTFGAFIVLSAGIGISVVVLIIERYAIKYGTKNKRTSHHEAYNASNNAFEDTNKVIMRRNGFTRRNAIRRDYVQPAILPHHKSY